MVKRNERNEWNETSDENAMEMYWMWMKCLLDCNSFDHKFDLTLLQNPTKKTKTRTEKKHSLQTHRTTCFETK